MTVVSSIFFFCARPQQHIKEPRTRSKLCEYLRLSIFLENGIDRLRHTGTGREGERDVARYGKRGGEAGGVVVVCADWAKRAACGFLLPLFFLFFPCSPFPLVVLITDGPPLTMPCYACKMQEATEGVRGVGRRVGWWARVRTVRTSH